MKKMLHAMNLSKVWAVGGMFILLAMFAAPAFGQAEAEAPAKSAKTRVPLCTDWSSHYFVYSKITDPVKMQQAQKDPRYWMQYYRQRQASVGQIGENVSIVSGFGKPTKPAPPVPPPPTKGAPSGDWSVSLGSVSTAQLAPLMFPAKFSFNVNAAPSCTNDYAVFASQGTTAGSVAAKATAEIDFTAAPDVGTIVVGNITYNMVSGSFTTISAPGTAGQCNIDEGFFGSSASTSASNLEGAITNPTGGSTISWECTSATNTFATATNPSSGVVDLTALTAGAAGNSIVLSATTTGTTLTAWHGGVSAGSQPSITGINNLYSGTASNAYDIGTVSSNALTQGGGATVGINAVTVTQSDPTTASATGTFSGAPTATTAITVVDGSNTLTLKTNAAGANAVGTFSAEPTSATAPALTIASGSNTTSLTTNATGAHVTGTFSEPPQTNTTMSFDSTGNTSTFSTNGTGSSAIGTFTAEPQTAATTFVVTAGPTPNVTTFATNATAAHVTGTFSGAVLTTTPAFSVTSGANTTTFTTSSTPASVIGTFNAAPTSTTQPTITVTAGSNTLTATTNATGPNVVGTFSSVITASPTPSIVLNSGSGSTTTTFTNNASTSSTSIAEFTGEPGSGNTITITFLDGVNLVVTAGNTTSGTCGGTSPNFTATYARSFTTSTDAANFTTAVNTCSSHGFSASQSTDNVTVTATALGQTSYTEGSSSMSWSAATGGSNGTNTCTGTAGTYALGATTTAQATAFAAAVNACAVGEAISATSSTSSVTVTDTTLGGTLTTTGGTNLGGFSWGTVNAGSNGTNSCTGTTTATFQYSATTSTLASNLAAAITGCATSPGFTAVASGATVTFTDLTPGAGINTFTDASNNTGIFSPGTVTAGTNGAASCSGTAPNITAGFVNSATTTTLATDLSAAITACNTASEPIGFTGAVSGSGVVFTDTTLGAAANTFTDAGGAAAPFTWGTLTAGTNGSNTCCTGTAPTLAGTYALSTSTTTLATDLAAAINASSATNFATAVSSTNTVTVTDLTAGSGTTFTVGGANDTGFFSWSAVTPGGNGTAACSGTAPTFTGTFVTAISTTTLASNLATAIAMCPAGSGVTATPTTNTVLVTNNTVGSGATLTAADTNNTGNFAWGTVTAGGNGSAACSGTAPTFTGTFAISTSTTTQATDLAAAITACPAAAGISATSSTNTVTVTDTTPGPSSTLSVGATGNTGIFTWGSVTPGTNGTNTCSSSTTGTFATSATTSTLASNLAAAITACPATIGVSAAASGSNVTVTALEPGSSGDSITLGATNASGIYAWNSAMTGGGNGTQSGTSFTWWNGASAVSADQLADNICSAFESNGTLAGSYVFSCSSAVDYFSVKDATAGSTGNTSTVSENMSGYSWSSSPDFEGGTDSGFCGTGGPTVSFAYDTHTGATGGGVTTSPSLSLDGTKILYVESIAAGSVLHVLRPNTAALNGTGTEGTVAVPVVPATVITSTEANAGSLWTSCLAGTGSCLFDLTFNTTTVTYSSPFYDYAYDTAYIGDDSGKLWKITGVFSSTPALATGNWATGITVHSGEKLGAPVFDDSTFLALVGDSTGQINYIMDSGATTGTCVSGSAPCLGTPSLSGEFSNVQDPPLVDGTTDNTFYFGSLTGTGGRVLETTETNTILATDAVGADAAPTQVHAGYFDYEYFVNGPTGGSMWVCGINSSNNPTLYQISFNASDIIQTPNATTLELGTGTGACSPVSEVYNSNATPPTDWIFVGIPSACNYPDPSGASTATGCIESFAIGNGTTDAFPTSGTAGAEPGGTSGIVVDNVSSDGHESSVYFGNLGPATCTGGTASGCAVQRLQSGVQ